MSPIVMKTKVKQMYHKFIFSEKHDYVLCDELLIIYLLFYDVVVSFHVKNGNVGLL